MQNLDTATPWYYGPDDDRTQSRLRWQFKRRLALKLLARGALTIDEQRRADVADRQAAYNAATSRRYRKRATGQVNFAKRET